MRDPKWKARLGGIVNWDPDPEVECLEHLIDEIDDTEVLDIPEYRRFKLKMDALSKLIAVKGTRSSFSPAELNEWLLRIVRIIRTYVTDDQVMQKIVRGIYETEIEGTSGPIRPISGTTEIFLEAPRSESLD